MRIRRAWRRIALSVALLASGAVGLALGTATSAQAAPRGLEGVPRLSHVFVIVLENEDYKTTWGPTSPAKFLNSIVPFGVLATNYYGVSHANGGGRVGLLMFSPMAQEGHATDAFYDHNALLRTIEDAFGIGEHLNDAASPKAHPMTDLFRH
jgi:hypothetical protein